MDGLERLPWSHSRLPFSLFLFPIIADLLSVTTCVCLLWKMRRMSEHKRSRLFSIQLWNLALSDALASTSTLVLNISCVSPMIDPSLAIDRVLVAGLLAGSYASCITEALIAAGFACSFWRYFRVCRWLRRAVLPIWLVALGLAIPQAWETQEYFNTMCRYQRLHTRWNEAEVSFLMLCFCVALLSHFVSLRRVWMYPETVQNVVWRMASVYLLTFIMTYGPFVMLLLDDNPAMLFGSLALTMKGLNGFFNATSCYVLSARQTGVASRIVSEPARREMTAGDEGPGAALPVADPDHLKGIVSFHVCFQSAPSISLVESDDSQFA